MFMPMYDARVHALARLRHGNLLRGYGGSMGFPELASPKEVAVVTERHGLSVTGSVAWHRYEDVHGLCMTGG